MLTNEHVNSHAIDVALEPVPSEHRPGGDCMHGATPLGTIAECEYGVWEMTAGVMYDTEAEELFVVVDGTATIEFLEPTRAPIEVSPGSVVTLAAGTKTRWTVHSERLRKVYVAP